MRRHAALPALESWDFLERVGFARHGEQRRGHDDATMLASPLMRRISANDRRVVGRIPTATLRCGRTLFEPRDDVSLGHSEAWAMPSSSVAKVLDCSVPFRLFPLDGSCFAVSPRP